MRGLTSHGLFKMFVVMAAALGGSVACACSVPVFRYALERWQSDVYQVVVFYDGELTDTQQAVVDSLGPEGEAGKLSANVEVHAVDVNGLDPGKDAELLALWKAEQTDELPRMAVYYPPNALARGRIWSGTPTRQAVATLLDSPARREAARRILKGETAVWIFVEGGQAERDDEKFEALQTSLRKAEQTLALPEISEKDVADGLVTIDPADLKIRFSTIRIARDDPAEAMFVQMLLRSEPDLLREEFAGEPMAFPLFGRCRALYALVGNGIVEGTVLEACAFLIGPCTCEVKSQNEQGNDVLSAVDWDSLIEPAVQIDKALPPLSGLGGFTSTPAQEPSARETETPGAAAQAADQSEAVANAESAAAGPAGAAIAPGGRDPDSAADSAGLLAATGNTLGTATLLLLGLGVLGVIAGSVFVLGRKQT